MNPSPSSSTSTATDLMLLLAPEQSGGGPHPVAVYLAGLSEGSRRTMLGALDTLARLLTDSRHTNAYEVAWERVRYVHAQALRSALAERYAPATARKILSALRGVLRACWMLERMSAEDYHRACAVQAVGGERLPAGRAITPAELRALMEACADDPSPAGARDAAIIALFYAGGLRVAELCRLDVGDWRHDAGSSGGAGGGAEQPALRVRGKRNKERLAYVVDSGARAALADWLQARGIEGEDAQEESPLFCAMDRTGVRLARPLRRLAPVTVRQRVLARRAKEAHILAPITPHDFRRTHISDLLDANVDIVTVSRMVGHARVETTARYDRRGERAKQQAAAQLRVPYRGRAANTNTKTKEPA